MSGVGSGYDLSASTYSPDGRMFQVEYAYKAVENSGTAVGLRVKDAVVLGVEKLVLSKMLVEGSNKRIHNVGRNCGIAIAGLVTDGRQLVSRARKDYHEYQSTYGALIPTKVLSERVAGFVQMYTLFSHLRPFGASVILAGYDESVGPQLFYVEPSGEQHGFYGVASGKATGPARTEIEKLDLENMEARQAVIEIAKIIHKVHDDTKDKDFELELSWICEASGYKHKRVPAELVEEASEIAVAALEEDDFSDEA